MHIMKPHHFIGQMALAFCLAACSGGASDTSSEQSDTAVQTSDANDEATPNEDVTSEQSSDALGPDPTDAVEVASDDSVSATEDTEDIADDESTIDVETDEPVVTEGWGIVELEVGESGCCLSLSQDHIVWAEDDDIRLYDRATGIISVVVEHPAIQKDPVLSDSHLIWADQRDGDFDLYIMDLDTMEISPLVTEVGDQIAASMDGDRLVWVDTPAGDIDSYLAEIWSLDLASADPALRLTDDLSEQSHPHVHGHKVVWADFRNDPDGQYMDPQGTSENNGDIMGYDLGTNLAFVVTEDPAKQLRPAIEGDHVVWLDWRDKQDPIGIEPEPKYHHFQVYVKMLPEGEEVFLESGGWQHPELWRRPGIHDGMVAWIAELDGTHVYVAPISTGVPVKVHSEVGVLQALDLSNGAIGWIGDGALGVAPLETVLMDE
jgi:beta propeller repeat protein